MIMATPMSAANPDFSNDALIWQSLKQAIAASSGFQRWQRDRVAPSTEPDVDSLVRRYLRETLETLAY
jgi:hypothetical protein